MLALPLMRALLVQKMKLRDKTEATKEVTTGKQPIAAATRRGNESRPIAGCGIQVLNSTKESPAKLEVLSAPHLQF